MSSHRPRLVVSAGDLPIGQDQVDLLRSAFDVVQVENLAEARRVAAESRDSLLLMPPEASLVEGLPHTGVFSILEQIGEGIGVVDESGTLTWANARLRESGAESREQLVTTCRRALEQFNQAGSASVPVNARPVRRFGFAADDAYYEVMVSIAAVDSTHARRVTAVVGIMWEVTASHQLQKKINAIDAAGAELMRIENKSIAELNMAERLKLLEDRIIHSVRELLHFDNFEIRLIDRETNQLELVIGVGLAPLKIGEVLYAEAEGNGISGFVAATGRSYLCNDAARDIRYRPGLDNAASALTVPLHLYDRVIGVFNIESNTPDAFTEQDRQFAEIFGRYIAMAMHILDLLVVERYTTNARTAENLLLEMDDPLGEITSQAAALRAGLTDDGLRRVVDRIIDAAGGIRRKLDQCREGPKTILGAEQEMQRTDSDPLMGGKRIIIADNEELTRDAIRMLLVNKGCVVTACAGGRETISELQSASAEHRTFDLVISDIRMPDCNGYDVFRTAKELCAETPVILITGFGYDPHHSIVRASQEGLHSFLFKPLKASQLLEAVSKALGGGGDGDGDGNGEDSDGHAEGPGGAG